MPKGSLCVWMSHDGCMAKRRDVTTWDENALGVLTGGILAVDREYNERLWRLIFSTCYFTFEKGNTLHTLSFRSPLWPNNSLLGCPFEKGIRCYYISEDPAHDSAQSWSAHAGNKGLENDEFVLLCQFSNLRPDLCIFFFCWLYWMLNCCCISVACIKCSSKSHSVD